MKDISYLRRVADVARKTVQNAWDNISEDSLSPSQRAAELVYIVAYRRTLHDILGEIAIAEAEEVIFSKMIDSV